MAAISWEMAAAKLVAGVCEYHYIGRAIVLIRAAIGDVVIVVIYAERSQPAS
jgi:hypothetical protein